MESNSEIPTLSRYLFDKPIEYEYLSEQSLTTPTIPEIPLSFDKGKQKTALGGSLSADAFSFSTQADQNTAVNVTLDGISNLM